MNSRFRFAIAWMAAASALVATAFAEPIASAPALKAAVRAELISEVETVVPGSEFAVSVKLQMETKWHTYWKNPGDGGLATRIRWTLPKGFEAGDIEWPAPIRFETSGIVSYGYAGEVLLVSTLRAPAELTSSGEIPILASVEWLGCMKICVPGRADLELKLKAAPIGAAKVPSAAAPLVAASRARVPRALAGWSTKAWRGGTTLFLELRPKDAPKERLDELYFFSEEEQVIEYAAPQHLERVKGRYVLRLDLSSAASATPKRLLGVLSGREGWTGAAGKNFAIDVPLEPATK